MKETLYGAHAGPYRAMDKPGKHYSKPASAKEYGLPFPTMK